MASTPLVSMNAGPPFMSDSNRKLGATGEPSSAAARDHDAAVLRGLLYEIKKEVVGQDRVLRHILIALLAQGHVLLEGLPGLAKTLMVQTLARTLQADFVRLQFTPDLVPSDIVGTRVYRASSESFAVELGPVFANFVLADEINRAPAKVQAAMLEVMAERQVSIGGHTYPVPHPFLVLATQNPIESEGVYPLPEAQRDRFLMKLVIEHPSYREELEIVRRVSAGTQAVEPVMSLAELVRLQNVAHHVYVDHAVADYAVRLIMATREPAEYGLGDVAPYIASGASPRATIGLVEAAKALALLHGRGFVLPEDIADNAVQVMHHRLILSYEALADGVTADDVLSRILSHVAPPVPAHLPRRSPPVASA